MHFARHFLEFQSLRMGNGAASDFHSLYVHLLPPKSSLSQENQLLGLFRRLMISPLSADSYLDWFGAHVSPTHCIYEDILTINGSDTTVMSQELIDKTLAVLRNALCGGMWVKSATMILHFVESFRSTGGMTEGEYFCLSKSSNTICAFENNSTICDNLAQMTAFDKSVLSKHSDVPGLNAFKRFVGDIIHAALKSASALNSLMKGDRFKMLAFACRLSPDSFVEDTQRILVSSPLPLEALVGRVVTSPLTDIPLALEAIVLPCVSSMSVLVVAVHMADYFAIFLACPMNSPFIDALQARNRMMRNLIQELVAIKDPVANELSLMYARWSPLMDSQSLNASLRAVVVDPLRHILSCPNEFTTAMVVGSVKSTVYQLSTSLGHDTRCTALARCDHDAKVIEIINHANTQFTAVEAEAASLALAALRERSCYAEAIELALDAMRDNRQSFAHRCFEELRDVYRSVLEGDSTNNVVLHPIFRLIGKVLSSCHPQTPDDLAECYRLSVTVDTDLAAADSQRVILHDYFVLSVSVWKLLGLESVLPPSVDYTLLQRNLHHARQHK